MIQRKLGKTGLNISVIGIGSHQFSGEWGRKFTQNEVDRILGKANELGINLIETAPCYGDHLSESFIGRSLKNSRKDWFIATKFGLRYSKYKQSKHIHDVYSAFSVGQVSKQLELSLKFLKTDYIDIYMFHTGTNDQFDNDELWDFLNKKVEEGKIRHLGISILNKLVVSCDLYQVENADKIGAEVISVVYNRLNHKAENRLIPLCREKKLGLIARVPLAKGFLTGKYMSGAKFLHNDHRSKYGDSFNNELLEKAEKIYKTEVPEGIEMSQWALSWCLRNDTVNSVIPGCMNVRQVESNAKACELISQ